MTAVISNNDHIVLCAPRIMGLQLRLIHSHGCEITLTYKLPGGYLNFCTRKKDTIMTYTAFCGKENRDYTACLKNVVNFIVTKMYKMNFWGSFFLRVFALTNVGHSEVKCIDMLMRRGIQWSCC
jgi:hypothetical protein